MSRLGYGDSKPDSSEQMAAGAKSHGEPRPGSKRPRDERGGQATAIAKDEPPRIQCKHARVTVGSSDSSDEHEARQADSATGPTLETEQADKTVAEVPSSPTMTPSESESEEEAKVPQQLVALGGVVRNGWAHSSAGERRLERDWNRF